MTPVDALNTLAALLGRLRLSGARGQE